MQAGPANEQVRWARPNLNTLEILQVDLNRARAPLLEIVTEPHMGSGVEAGEYASEQLADSSRRERFGEENGGNVYGEFSLCSECCSS
ncbi:hypothetical protein Bca52824_081298 [Brassica carinata]|uniref:Aspartyl/Glutamyl-tRNA(Gln) amidotransferase subunit B/E catalytic domain-containing protein n=1 Tax=Brassica carinata TaxID=52824 RepID=A0A8X7TR46_BRACI|nr:hypothetical protein Bca52824_081298 [Brassica carinata]